MDQEKALVRAPVQDLIPEVKSMEGLAKHLLESRLFPNAQSLAGVVTIIEYGRELGLPPVASLQTMVVIQGKLAMEAKAMLAVAQKNAGVSWKVIELTDDRCKMVFMRPGFENALVEFTAAEAKEAGLLSKTNWKLYRQDMLFARCASRGVRRIAPDAVLGLYSTEEMKDVGEIEKMGVIVPSDVEVKTAEPPVKVEPDKQEDPLSNVDTIVFGVEPDDAVFPETTPGRDDVPPVPITEADVDLTEDSVLNTYIAQIKQAVERSGIDDKKWREWLIGQGQKMNRNFVGRIGRAVRYHKGKPEDVKYLQSVIDRAISLYVKETTNE